MTNLFEYQKDGAHAAPRAVLAILQAMGNIEQSYNSDTREYDARINVARWENCREQGYVVSLRSPDYQNQINIAFFEHRNSDDIHAVRWEQSTLNSPTIDTAEFGDVYKNKFDTSFNVEFDQIYQMAEWIHSELEGFYELHSKPLNVEK